MKNLGLWYDRPADELVFLTREEEERIVERYLVTVSKVGKELYPVLKIWRRFNPDKPITDITIDEFLKMSGSISRLRILLRQMRLTCYNENSQDWEWYGNEGIGICDEWRSGRDSSDNFVVWSLANGYEYKPNVRKGDQLSIDRRDRSKGYYPSNCQWIPHRVNCGKTRRSEKK